MPSFAFMAVTKVLTETIQMTELFVFAHGLEIWVLIFGSWFSACGEAESVAGTCGSHLDRQEAKKKEDPGTERTSEGLLPPTSPYHLKILPPPKIVPPARDRAFNS